MKTLPQAKSLCLPDCRYEAQTRRNDPGWFVAFIEAPGIRKDTACVRPFDRFVKTQEMRPGKLPMRTEDYGARKPAMGLENWELV